MASGFSPTANYQPPLSGKSSADNGNPVEAWFDPVTHRLLVDASVTVEGVATATGQTDGSQKTQIVDAGGEVCTVTGGKLDVNASIDTTGLATSAIQTNGSQVVKISDATNIANTLKSDGTAAGQNSLLIAGAYKEVASLSTASTTNNDLLASLDVSNYAWFSIQIVGTWTGTVTFQGSNDNSNFSSVNLRDVASGSTFGATTTGNGIFSGPIQFRYLRIRVTSGGTGTVTGTLELYANAKSPMSNVVGLGTGASAIGKLAANSGVDIGDVDVLSIAAGDNNIGNVDIVTVPADPFGANADAASATGSISAKLRYLAASGIAGMTVLPTGTNSIGKISDITTTVVPGTGATNLGKAEDNAHSSGDTGVFMLAVRDDTIGATSGAENDYEALHTNENGALWAELSPSTKGGVSVANFNSGDTYTALTNSAQVIKASAGKFFGYYIYNPNASATYVMLYNIAAASVTVGTSTAQMVFCIPASSGANLSLPYGIPFTNAGWSIAAATTGGGNGAPATALEAMVFYL